MKLHFLSAGRLRMRRGIFFPEAERGETVEMPVISALMRHRGGNVLFDTGCHPDVAAQADVRWGGLAKVMNPIMGPSDNVVESLKTVGLQPDDIDVVICSHLHPDHCGCNVFFKQATVMVHADELAAARAPGAEAVGYLRAEWDQPNTIDAVTSERDVFGDGRITLVHLPGHTPGSMGAVAALDSGVSFALAADTVALRACFDRDHAPKNTQEPERLLGSYAKVRRIEASGATVICGHDAAQWDRLRKGVEYYD